MRFTSCVATMAVCLIALQSTAESASEDVEGSSYSQPPTSGGHSDHGTVNGQQVSGVPSTGLPGAPLLVPPNHSTDQLAAADGGRKVPAAGGGRQVSAAGGEGGVAPGVQAASSSNSDPASLDGGGFGGGDATEKGKVKGEGEGEGDGKGSSSGPPGPSSSRVGSGTGGGNGGAGHSGAGSAPGGKDTGDASTRSGGGPGSSVAGAPDDGTSGRGKGGNLSSGGASLSSGSENGVGKTRVGTASVAGVNLPSTATQDADTNKVKNQAKAPVTTTTTNNAPAEPQSQQTPESGISPQLQDPENTQTTTTTGASDDAGTSHKTISATDLAKQKSTSPATPLPNLSKAPKHFDKKDGITGFSTIFAIQALTTLLLIVLAPAS